MSVELIHAAYNPETGISTATINTELGKFIGESKLHEEDKDIESTFAGCHYAEMRALIKYMKKHIEILKYEIKGIEKVEKAMMNKKEYLHNSSEARTLRKQKKILEKERDEWKSRVGSLHQKMYDMMKNRRKTLGEMINKNKGDDKK